MKAFLRDAVKENKEWVTGTVEVQLVTDDPSISGAKQKGVLNDGSHKIEFISWEASEQQRVKHGKRYKITDLFIDDGTAIFRSDTLIEEVEVEKTPVEQLQSITGEFKRFDYTNTLYVTPVIVKAFQPFHTLPSIDAPKNNRNRPRRANHSVTAREDGFVVDSRIQYHTDHHEDYGTIRDDIWKYEKNVWEREQEFIKKYSTIPELTVEVRDKFELNELKICSDCGDIVARKIDSCYDCETEMTEKAVIHEVITVSGVFNTDITVDGLNKVASKLGYGLNYSAEASMGLIGKYVEEETTVSIFGQDYLSDNYGRPSTSYHSFHIGTSTENVTEETVDSINDNVRTAFEILSLFNFGLSDCKTVEPQNNDETFIVYESSTMSAEQLLYRDFSEAIDEVTKDDYKHNAILALPDNELWDDYLPDVMKERIPVNHNLVEQDDAITKTTEYHLERLYEPLFSRAGRE